MIENQTLFCSIQRVCAFENDQKKKKNDSAGSID